MIRQLKHRRRSPSNPSGSVLIPTPSPLGYVPSSLWNAKQLLLYYRRNSPHPHSSTVKAILIPTAVPSTRSSFTQQYREHDPHPYSVTMNFVPITAELFTIFPIAVHHTISDLDKTTFSNIWWNVRTLPAQVPVWRGRSHLSRRG